MSLIEQTEKITSQDIENVRRAKEELNKLYVEHNFNEYDVHNIFHIISSVDTVPI